MRNLSFVGIAVAVFAAVVFAQSSASAQESRQLAKIIEEAKKEKELSIYGSFTGSLQATPEGRKFLGRFREKYPFIEMKFTNLSGIRLMPRIANEYRAGQYLVDIFATSAQYIYPLVKERLMGKYLSAERDAIPKGFKDAEGYWTSWFIPVYSIAYNTRLVSPKEAPKSYEDLLDPRWKGRQMTVVESNMLRWFTGQVERWGREKTVGYLEKLAKQEPLFKSGGGATLEAQLLAAGEFKIIHSTTLHSIIDIKERGGPVEWVRMKEPLLAIPSLISLAARAPHPNAAKLYIDYVLSEEGQRLLSPSVYVPARAGVETTPPGLLKNVELHPVAPHLFEPFNEYQQLIRRIFGS
ncbi:MAG TPA: extracellular solute-binding protein [Candidatus Acidoferrales bacterium]|nr:extracellular solute-binding protein [Candidatus Acidoferrales bacterium]